MEIYVKKFLISIFSFFSEFRL